MEVRHRLNGRSKAMEGLRGLWKIRCLCIDANVGMMKGVVAPAVLYGAEAWVLNTRGRRAVEQQRCLIRSAKDCPSSECYE